jgi:uncharacterized protein (TIGR02996 family)
MRTFVCNEGKSSKFWDIDLRGDAFTVTFGRVGTCGQAQHKGFDDPAKALEEHDKLIARKLKKGYKETTAKAAATPLAASLETALVEDPDDLSAHMAYADHLAEQGDPRGELIQIQLALEDESRKPAERKRLRAREEELLTLHGHQWLGETGRFLWGKWCGPDKPWRYSFARGWLDTVRVLPGPEEALEILARAPEIRLLRRLEVVYDMRYHPDFGDWVEGPAHVLGIEDEEAYEMVEDGAVLGPLLAPHWCNLRVLRLGFSDDDPDDLEHSTMVGPFGDCNAERLLKLLGKCPRLEELYLNIHTDQVARLFASPALGGLRVLQYYFGVGRYRSRTVEYPLSALAGNPALVHLRALRLHPGRDGRVKPKELESLLRSPNLPALEELQVHMTQDGDEQARLIAGSGILRRLKSLDLAYGNMTDEGARLLAESPDVKHLDVLNVSRNALTAAGIEALRDTGVEVVADDQHDADDEAYLYEVDAE